MRNVECDVGSLVRRPERRLLLVGIGEAQAARSRCLITSQISSEDCPQQRARGDEALTVLRKMKAGGALQLVGRKQFLPTGFVWAKRLQIDSPELHFVFGQRERRLDLEARVGDVHDLAHAALPTD